MSERERAREPEDLGRLFVERANAGDVEGLVALYEPDAVLAVPGGQVQGSSLIREFYAGLLADGGQFAPGVAQSALRKGNLALTSTVLANGKATAEVARRQPDGTWRWLIDQPAL
ncbi:nuclear transport factor 2 family protein [Allokutzneria sp. A3M-2-11 16]|uniref:YybH family protein n=1 Tax=Allokutzneria sp. A3M-2-11 16 TaxID=2962043 RepID=UPI0020B85639|nr:nuclear transport factor 2 family protein [Allokutzneria sp. A3M-2-11 16]MCP3803216.1 nuclear transport factor 2 family protein [Allokutzneria sp. A3M-2-11 16]